jgi:hypothetical protein
VDLEDLIENIDGFSDEHLYALIGGSVEPSRSVPQSGLALVEKGKEFFQAFLEKFRGAVCEKDGLRDQVKKVGSVQTQKAMIPVVTAWIIARGGGAGMQITQVVAIYLAILMVRVTQDTVTHRYQPAK